MHLRVWLRQSAHLCPDDDVSNYALAELLRRGNP
jgi:hypothetical protein